MKYEYALLLKISIVIILIISSIAYIILSSYEPIKNMVLEVPVEIRVGGQMTVREGPFNTYGEHPVVIDDITIIENLYQEISTYPKIKKYYEQKHISPWDRVFGVRANYNDDVDDILKGPGRYNDINNGKLHGFEIFSDGRILFHYIEYQPNDRPKVFWVVSRISMEMIKELMEEVISKLVIE